MALTESPTSAKATAGPPHGAAAGGTTTAGAVTKPATLDDIMIAMDVVDTVRHREDLVARELNEAGREAELIARLKQLYHEQGIEVPDRVLSEGVKALKESRFTYTPAPAGLKRTLLTIWVTRRRWGKIAAAGLALVVASWGYQYLSVTRPARLAEQRAHVEMTRTLPGEIRQTHADILKVQSDPAARQTADQLLGDGERAIRDKDRTAMQAAARGLKDLLVDLNRSYTLTIVSRAGETSGVWRRPPKGGTARNYYLIVEAIGSDGKAKRIAVRNEETGEIENVDKFGVRVPQATFDTVAADKRDDGIVQRNRFGAKKRGTLAVDYAMPFEGGMITRW